MNGHRGDSMQNRQWHVKSGEDTPRRDCGNGLGNACKDGKVAHDGMFASGERGSVG